MATQINCPKCGASFRVNDSARGKRVKCPKCKSPFRLSTPNGKALPPNVKRKPLAPQAPPNQSRNEAETEDETARGADVTLRAIWTITAIVLVGIGFFFWNTSRPAEAENRATASKAEQANVPDTSASIQSSPPPNHSEKNGIAEKRPDSENKPQFDPEIVAEIPAIEQMKRPADYDRLGKEKIDEAGRLLQKNLDFEAETTEDFIKPGFKIQEVQSAVTLIESAWRLDPGLAFAEMEGPGQQSMSIRELLVLLQEDEPSEESSAVDHYNDGLIASSTGKYSQAIAHYEKALELDPQNPWSANNLAWLLATCPDRSKRNGLSAVQYAKQANRFANWRYWSFQSTLAAALAELGASEMAAEVHELGMQNFTGIRGTEGGFDGPEWQANLKLYRRGERPNYDKSWAEDAEAAKQVAEKETEDKQEKSTPTKKNPALAPIIGYWRAEDGRHFFIDYHQHIIVQADGKESDPVSHKSANVLEIPSDLDTTNMPPGDRVLFVKLLKDLADTRLLAFGNTEEEYQGATFYILKSNHGEILNQGDLEITRIVAVSNNSSPSELVEIINLGGTITVAKTFVKQISESPMVSKLATGLDSSSSEPTPSTTSNAGDTTFSKFGDEWPALRDCLTYTDARGPWINRESGILLHLLYREGKYEQTNGKLAYEGTWTLEHRQFTELEKKFFNLPPHHDTSAYFLTLSYTEVGKSHPFKEKYVLDEQRAFGSILNNKIPVKSTSPNRLNWVNAYEKLSAQKPLVTIWEIKNPNSKPSK